MQRYFITSTIVKWRRIIKDEVLQIIIDALTFQVSKEGISLNAYVIMPNHLHLIIEVDDPNKLSSFLRDFHGYTSKQILESRSINKEEYISERVDRSYQVWQATHAVKEITSEKFYRQKLNYIHGNPCQEHWLLSDAPVNYPYSSANVYLGNGESVIPLVVEF